MIATVCDTKDISRLEELAVQPSWFFEIIRSEARERVGDHLGLVRLSTLRLGSDRHLLHGREDGDGSQDFG